MRTFFLFFLILFAANTHGNPGLVQTIQQVKPSIVAIAILNPTGSPRTKLIGTGFVIAPGNQIVTNHHVIAAALDTNRQEEYVVLSGTANQVVMHRVISRQSAVPYDLAVLTIDATLPALTLSKQNTLLPEGSDVAFTGFPITSVLGLYPATHRGIIAAQTPVVIPADSAAQLQAAAIRRLGAPYMVYQLDATAYPGNSGSPLYLPHSGEVIGVINQVHIKSTREAVLSDPSGITYAIPIQHLQTLLQGQN